MKNKIALTLIVPCFNEETNIQKGVLDKIGNYTKDDAQFTEVLIVDDGSTDDSKRIIKSKYLPRFPKMRLIENHHGGKAYAVMTGIKQASGTHVLFSDIDLATPIEEAQKLIQETGRYPIVIGSRSNKREGAPFFRKVMAKGSIVVKNLLVGMHDIHDTQCGFKLFEKRAALAILDKLRIFTTSQDIAGSSVSAGFDIEFLFVAKKLRYAVKEVPVAWRHVETKNVNFLKDSIESLKDYIRIRLNDIRGAYS